MLATTATTTLLGLEAHLVRVEVESSRGPAAFELVGLPEASVKESRVRVRSALQQLGVALDEQRIVVNLAPGDVRKGGSAFDLALAVSILVAVGTVPPEAPGEQLFLGELSLTGELRAVPGLLPQLLFARKSGIKQVIVPTESGAEASAVPGLRCLVARDLEEVVEALRGQRQLPLAEAGAAASSGARSLVDMAEVKGQAGARRALEIAAAGHHHLLMLGPPGGGKSMLSRRLPTLLPPLSEDEALEASAVHSVAGTLPAGRGLLGERPFRAPHHSVSDAGLIGGGYPPRPGELSLAHHGVLFLDELPEFRRTVLEALRQPLEDGELVIARARARATFPARPLLVAASNPCPCGYGRDGTGRCGCAPDRVRSYMGRLSGPLVDRLDLHLYLPPVAVDALGQGGQGEGSAAIRERVIRARKIQEERASAGLVSARTNAALGPAETEAVASPDPEGRRLLLAAVERLGLSARAYAKVQRVARTIADLAGDARVGAPHVAEAVQYRLLDRSLARGL
jgi:magnesium chelatase family protein